MDNRPNATQNTQYTIQNSQNITQKSKKKQYEILNIHSQIQTVLSRLQVAKRVPDESQETPFTSFSCPSNVANKRHSIITIHKRSQFQRSEIIHEQGTHQS